MRSGTYTKAVTPIGLPWPLEVVALLDEQHLCAWSNCARVRREFERGLVEHVSAFKDAQVLVLDGKQITDMSGFCNAIERGLRSGRMGEGVPAGDAANGVEGGDEDGVLRVLRSREAMQPPKRRFVIWNDAHVLLSASPREFGRAADALIGTAAENELVGEDMLLLQRVVFIGRASLDVYAEDPRGQFLSWYSERNEKPLWSVVTGLGKPHVYSARIENLCAVGV